MLKNYKSLNYITAVLKDKNQKEYLINGGAYMQNNNNYKIEKQTKQVVLELPSSVKDGFDAINNKYSKELSAWKKRQSDLNPDDQTLKQLADEDLNEYKNTQIDKIAKKYAQKEYKISNAKDSLTDKHKKTLNTLSKNHDEDVLDLRYGSAQKGWRESSIYTNEMKEIQNEYNRITQQEKTDYDKKMQEFQFQESLLETEKEEALKRFDIAYAEKVSKRIEQLKKQFEKSYSSQAKEIESQIENLENRSGMEKTALVLEYLKGKTKEEKLKFIEENPELQNELGKNWFAALVSWLNR